MTNDTKEDWRVGYGKFCERTAASAESMRRWPPNIPAIAKRMQHAFRDMLSDDSYDTGQFNIMLSDPDKISQRDLNALSKAATAALGRVTTCSELLCAEVERRKRLKATTRKATRTNTGWSTEP
jgi:hypothetical protein